ncbi:alpha/beta hydrolase-fold protein [Paraflavitalea sp. CAU 1676]|uniref:alpha/beta hydrolase n=1 Tax=Paraflavitalea sp. CAU 1676 TaxID=3032598 RepID=UPI0023DB8CA5|nr:alpha/beta hydrolase-fold protein [Paraflavitalea sp. CAU 1676]MDF2190334.1 alpha/beta hydrolase-fold protein [Paraflavitalea sp. CAU 1676]
MKTPFLAIFLTILVGAANAQTDSVPNRKAFARNYYVDTIQSVSLNAKRTIKIYLPDDFKPADKYPVIYVLDENWMFEPVVSDVAKLLDFDVIPKCIVVGINSPNRSNDLTPNLNTGAFTGSNKKFNDYLTKEVPEHITRKYSAPVFSILVGHSDGATFAQNAMTANPAAFRGVICLSQNLFGNELEQYINYSKEPFPNNNYYFVASGTRDATSRLRSGMKLDSLFRTNSNPCLKVKHEVYEADHSGVAGMGLANGLGFIFSDYYQPNGWDRRLADSLRSIHKDPTVLIESTLERINKIYGTDAKADRNAIMDLAFGIITNKDQAKSYLEYFKKNLKVDDQFNSSAAQLYERINEYDIALEYWTKYLNDPASYKGNFFYFRRPIELLAYKMNKPDKAIAFAEEWEKKAPANVQLSFKFFIAKIASEKNVLKKKGKAYIGKFIANYDAAKTQYSLEDAKKIQGLLE